MTMTILQFVGGFVLLLFGAEYLVRGAVALARRLKVSPMLIGMTIVAYGTTAPELVVSLQAAFAGQPGIAVGNVVGSNIFNLLLILAVTCAIAPVPVPRGTGWYDLAFMLALTVFLWPICTSNNRIIGRVEGALLLTAYLGYMTWRTVVEMR